MAGDRRITEIYRDCMETLLSTLAHNDTSTPSHQLQSGLCLPKLPGPLEQLNGRTLNKSMVINFHCHEGPEVSWDGEKPAFLACQRSLH